MQSYGRILKLQFTRMLGRPEFYMSLSLVMVLVAISFVESCLHFWGSDAAGLPSAAYAWVGNLDNMQIMALSVFVFYFIFLAGSVAFGDGFYLDAKRGTATLVATRCPAVAYALSTMVVAFAGGVLVVVIPLAISQLLAFLVFPATVGPYACDGALGFAAFEDSALVANASNALFPGLYVSHPYLSNGVFIGYASLWAGLAGAASVVTSLFLRKSRLLVIGLPTLIYLISMVLLPPALTVANYLYPCTQQSDLSWVFFFGCPLLAIAVMASCTLFALRRKGDLLL